MLSRPSNFSLSLPAVHHPAFFHPASSSSSLGYLYYISVGKSNRFSFQLNNCGIKVSVKEVCQSIQLSFSFVLSMKSFYEFSPTIDFFYRRCTTMTLLFDSSQSIAETCDSDLYFSLEKCALRLLPRNVVTCLEFKTGQ